jgi:hypothetical protein
MNRIHVLDTSAAHVRPSGELVVAIGPAAATLRAKGVPVVEVKSSLAAALYVRDSRPAMLRVSLADPLGFFDVLLERRATQQSLVA